MAGIELKRAPKSSSMSQKTCQPKMDRVKQAADIRAYNSNQT